MVIKIPFDHEKLLGRPGYKLRLRGRGSTKKEIDMCYKISTNSYHDPSLIRSYLKKMNEKYNVFSKDNLKEINNMFTTYENWHENRPKGKRDWKYLSFEDFDPQPADFEPNEWDRYLERTVGTELKISEEERAYIEKHFPEQFDIVPKEWLLNLQKIIKTKPYIDRNTDLSDPKPVNIALKVGGICMDFTYSFGKIAGHDRERELVHLYTIPTSFFYPKFSGSKRYKQHNIITVIHTDPPEITFMGVTPGDKKAKDMKVLLKKKPK